MTNFELIDTNGKETSKSRTNFIHIFMTKFLVIISGKNIFKTSYKSTVRIFILLN